MPGEGTSSSSRHSNAPYFPPKSSPGVGAGETEMGYVLDGVVIAARISMA